ncbi:ABC transporter substrate-binding protein [Streptomyces sp. NA04227]|uniref:ABC transporter substrate-binding protein n=1 Tax=Streptomyces sp. NA04227 TaxID=2742136 RepID=UPI001590F6F9|nr:ABC transporter substrate-binding protein [Streptomyces sp. NA04227]QKW10867.1 ABC transporter substrate-binding protein [Streptomyces sp. NA04227]
MRPTTSRRTGAIACGTAAVLILAACANPDDGATTEVPDANGTGDKGSSGKSTIRINNSPDQNRVTTKKVDSIAAEVPARIRESGRLRIVASADSSPPLGFYATDDKTRIGAEVDLAYLVANVLGLKPEFTQVAWENIFVGLDSGKYDVGFSNITDTEERKEKYDFASYRKDDLAFEARKGSGLKVRDYRDVAGRTVAVDSGTNQEKVLLAWSDQAERAGLEPVDIKYYKASTDTQLALRSGRIELFLGPNPTAAYRVASAGKTEIVGTLSGAGDTLQGLIAATTRKNNGLVEPLADAVNEIIDNGTYAEVLKRWGLSGEAVPESKINPPGLPKTAK